MKEYMPDHPGGGELIEEHLGKNIEEPFEDAEHTKHAKKLMMGLPVVGKIGSKSSSKPDSPKEVAPTKKTSQPQNTSSQKPQGALMKNNLNSFYKMIYDEKELLTLHDTN